MAWQLSYFKNGLNPNHGEIGFKLSCLEGVPLLAPMGPSMGDSSGGISHSKNYSPSGNQSGSESRVVRYTHVWPAWWDIALRKWLGAYLSRNGPLFASFHPQHGRFVASCDKSQKKTLQNAILCPAQDVPFPPKPYAGANPKSSRLDKG